MDAKENTQGTKTEFLGIGQRSVWVEKVYPDKVVMLKMKIGNKIISTPLTDSERRKARGVI